MSAPRHANEGERRVILDAALHVMRENGYAQAQLGDILARAGISTRAFYRHFQSKDDLLLALYRENAEAAATRLRARVAAADSPLAKLAAWIDETLSLGYDRRRARRASVLASDAARRTVGYREESSRGDAALSAPLLEVLESGVVSGDFPTCDPADDARTIHAIVWHLVGDAMFGTPAMTEAEARAPARRFCFTAIGVGGDRAGLV